MAACLAPTIMATAIVQLRQPVGLSTGPGGGPPAVVAATPRLVTSGGGVGITGAAGKVSGGVDGAAPT